MSEIVPLVDAPCFCATQQPGSLDNARISVSRWGWAAVWLWYNTAVALLAEIVLLLILLGSCGPAVQALLEMMHAQRRQSSRATGAKCYTASAADFDVEEDDEAGVNKGGKVGTAAALL